MSKDDVDLGRRRFLLTSTTVVGGVGMFMSSIPFVSSWWPNAKAQAAGEPIELDITKLIPGQQVTVAWRGKPVFVIRRPKDVLDRLDENRDTLRDPDSKVDQQPIYARNRYRSLRPDILVLVGVCTHLGCSPKYRPVVGELGKGWPGGFYCPCHGSKFDLAGRVFQGVPAPINLEVPPHKFIEDKLLIVGVDPETINQS